MVIRRTIIKAFIIKKIPCSCTYQAILGCPLIASMTGFIAWLADIVDIIMKIINNWAVIYTATLVKILPYSRNALLAYVLAIWTLNTEIICTFHT